MKKRDLIGNVMFIAGMLLSAAGIVILEVLNFREAVAWNPGFDVGTWASVAGIVLMAVSLAVQWLPISVGKAADDKEDKL